MKQLDHFTLQLWPQAIKMTGTLPLGGLREG